MWKRYSVWMKLKDSIQAIGTVTQLSLIFENSQFIWNIITAAIQLGGLLIPIWIEDRNQDGLIDVFEKEVTVKVKSDAPIETDVKVETKTDTP
jgi:hypothetical protein